MTSVERALNKDDLLAYKAYDGNQYALVPGVTSNAKIFDRSKLPGVAGTVYNINSGATPNGQNIRNQMELYAPSAIPSERDNNIVSRQKARASSMLENYNH